MCYLVSNVYVKFNYYYAFISVGEKMSETIFPKKMIVASDGSKHSLHAAEKAAQMAKSSKSDVVIVHVLQPYIHLTTAPGLVDIGAAYEIDNEGPHTK